jgi:nitrous oxidase accessory protein
VGKGMNKYPLWRKYIAVGIIIVFAVTSITPCAAQNNEKSFKPISRDNWLYVGGNGSGNYSKIQNAINDSHDGDTVFVYDDSSPYYENVVIDKSINLIGENKETTVVDSQENGTCISIIVDNVNVSGFTIQNSSYWYAGIEMVNSNYINISSNILKNNSGPGLNFNNANNNIITKNIIIQNWEGIFLRCGQNNLIEDNFICFNSHIGMDLYTGLNTVSNNNISSNGYDGLNIFNIDSLTNIANNYINGNPTRGISIWISTNVIVSNNIILNNGIGIEIEDSTSIIYNNSLLENSEYGISLKGSNNNIFNNTFVHSGLVDKVLSHNQIYNNEINGKPLIYFEGVSGATIDNAGQIILMSCKNINIMNINLSHASIGLMLFNTTNCVISNTNISCNNLAVYIWFSSENKFIKNNFIQDGQLVSFKVDSPGRNNIWRGNYYDKKTPFLPIIMIGTLITPFVIHVPFPPPGGDIPIVRPKFYFDWFPAHEPYNIGG